MVYPIGLKRRVPFYVIFILRLTVRVEILQSKVMRCFNFIKKKLYKEVKFI